MPHPLDKATADGHNVDGGLKAIGLTDHSETPSFGENSLGFVSTKLSSVWMLAPVPSAGTYIHNLSLFLMIKFLANTLMSALLAVNNKSFYYSFMIVFFCICCLRFIL